MNREIRPLTGLRGVAACWVVACHWSGAELTGTARNIALHGYAAVDLFMILSGFVLAMTYAPRLCPGSARDHGYFVWQRFCRLYPLYAVTTLVCLMEAWWFQTGVFGPDGRPAVPAVISNLLMTTTHLWEVDAIDGPSWSISVEFTLNLLFPLFIVTCVRPSRWSAIAIAGISSAALLLVSVMNHRLDGGVTGELGTLDTRLMYLRCGPEFALGMLCWRLSRQAQWSDVFGSTACLATTMAAMLAMTPFKAMDLPFVLACCVLVIGLAAERSPLATLLGSPLLHWLGTISFSMYLWHAAFLPLRPGLMAILPASSPLMVANTVGLVLVFALSTLSYHRFEVPVRRWLRGHPPLAAMRKAIPRGL